MGAMMNDEVLVEIQGVNRRLEELEKKIDTILRELRNIEYDVSQIKREVQ